MAKNLSSTVRDVVAHAAKDAIKNLADAKPEAKKSNGRLSGAKGLAAGAGLAAMAPLAKKGVDAVRSGSLPTSPAKLTGKAASNAGDRVGAQLKDAVSSKVDEAGGAGGLVKDAAGGLLPFGGGGDSGGGGKGGMPGVGKGRRMPVQQSMDVAVPLEAAYNQWTQFEDWPNFMHRVTRVTQEDPCTVSFATKIWGKTKEFEAKIETQRPDERIKWRVSQGITHTGVVTFHELAPRLTRIEVSLDVDPGSLIEKAARGMRHVKRAVRADLHRFKAFIEMNELETGAWRGVIEDGELVEDHDPSYDEERDYSDIDEIRAEAEESDESDESDEADEGEDSGDDGEDTTAEQDDDQQRGRSQRFKRQAERTRGSSSGSSRGERSSDSGSRSRSATASRTSSSRTTGGDENGSSKRSGSSSNREGGSTTAKRKTAARS